MANGKGLLSQGQKEQALYKGLLQLGAQLSAGSGGNRPVSTLQALSQGGAGFADAYGQSVDKAKNRAIQQRELDYQDEVRKRESDKLASLAAYKMSLPPSVRQQAEVMGIPQFAAAEFQRSQTPAKETFETVENPFGKGGIYQRSSTTGKLDPVYTPPTPKKSGAPVKIIGENGKPILVSPDDAIGKTPYEKPIEPPSEKLDVNQMFNAERKLGSEFSKETADEKKRIAGYQSLEAIFNDPTKSNINEGTVVQSTSGDQFALDSGGAADLALIFGYMKMLDPSSVVREGEFALAEKTGGITDSLWSEYEKLTNGGRLTPSVRKSLMMQARNQYDAAVKSYKDKYDSALDIAGRYSGIGVDPVRSIGSGSVYEPQIDYTNIDSLVDFYGGGGNG